MYRYISDLLILFVKEIIEEINNRWNANYYLLLTYQASSLEWNHEVIIVRSV